MKFFKKFWWLEIAFPIILGFAVWSAFTYVLYGGSRRDRLASQGEKYFIEMALRSAGEEAKQKDKVLVVSLDEGDLQVLPPSPATRYKGASIETYAAVLKEVAAKNPQYVFLSWFPEAHRTDENYLQPIINAIEEVRDQTKIYVVYPVAEIGLLPQKLRKAATVLEGDDCHYEVMSYCSYDKKWSNWWVIQTIADLFWGADSKTFPRYHLSTSLPHTLPNYLLNLPLRESLNELSFRDVLVQKNLPNLSGKAVFIGDTIAQDPEFAVEGTVLQRVFTIHDNQNLSVAKGGTPYHVFWAQLAQMFVDRNTVAVPPRWALEGLTIFLCGGLLLLLWKFPAYYAFGVYFGYALLLPFLNGLLVRWLHFYLPSFDLIYAGCMTFLVPAFGLMSFELYRRWKLEELERSLSRKEALKTNFISLISHNLNTPVAKMYGLLDILLQSRELQEVKPKLLRIRKLVARLQLCVRAVLIGSSLRDRKLHEETFSLNSLKNEVDNLARPVLERMGLSFRIETQADEDDDLLVPFRIDARAFAFAVASLMAMQTDKIVKDGKVDMRVRREDDARDSYQLEIESLWSLKAPIEDLDRFLDFLTHSQLPGEHFDDFFEETLLRYLFSFRTVYGGRVHYSLIRPGVFRIRFFLNVPAA